MSGLRGLPGQQYLLRGACGTITTRRPCPYPRKESTHDHVTPTDARRPPAPELFPRDHHLLSPLCRQLCPAFPDPPRPPRSRAYPPVSALSRPGEALLLVAHPPNRLCPALFLSHPAGQTLDDCVYPPTQAPQDPPNRAASSGSRDLTPGPPSSQNPRHPDHHLCRRPAGLGTPAPPGHGCRQGPHGPVHPARERPAGSLCDALPTLARSLTAILATLSAPHLAVPSPDPTKPLTRKTIDALCQQAGVKAGLHKPVHPHTLRHCFAS